MKHLNPRHVGKPFEGDVLLKVEFDVFVHSPQRPGRQSAARLRGQDQLWQAVDHVRTRPRVQTCTFRIVPSPGGTLWRGNKCWPKLGSASGHQACGQITAIFVMEERMNSFKYRPQTDAFLETVIVTRERCAGVPICADDAL